MSYKSKIVSAVGTNPISRAGNSCPTACEGGCTGTCKGGCQFYCGYCDGTCIMACSVCYGLAGYSKIGGGDVPLE